MASTYPTRSGYTVTWTPEPRYEHLGLGLGRWSCNGCNDRSGICKIEKAVAHAKWCITRWR